jgi:hypothetical protein
MEAQGGGASSLPGPVAMATRSELNIGAEGPGLEPPAVIPRTCEAKPPPDYIPFLARPRGRQPRVAAARARRKNGLKAREG